MFNVGTRRVVVTFKIDDMFTKCIIYDDAHTEIIGTGAVECSVNRIADRISALNKAIVNSMVLDEELGITPEEAKVLMSQYYGSYQ